MLSFEEAESLMEQLIDMEVQSIMSNQDEIMKIVYESVINQYTKMDPSEILDMAKYHGLVEELKEVK